jgi:hypothetical protein
VPIKSLPQEWLWCETWCSTDELKNAKSIDLCNNPLTKVSPVLPCPSILVLMHQNFYFIQCSPLLPISVAVSPFSFLQCFRYMTFWYWSRPANPYYLRIRILLFFSVAFKMTTKIKFFLGFLLLLTGTVCIFTSVFKDTTLITRIREAQILTNSRSRALHSWVL